MSGLFTDRRNRRRRLRNFLNTYGIVAGTGICKALDLIPVAESPQVVYLADMVQGDVHERRTSKGTG